MEDSKDRQDYPAGSPVVLSFLGPNDIPITQVYDHMFVEEFGGVINIRGRKSYIEIQENHSDHAAILNLARMLADAKKEIAQLQKKVDEPEKEDLSLEQTMLKSLREVHGWSRKDIATELGVSSEYVRLLERGDRTPSHPVAYKIRKIHG